MKTLITTITLLTLATAAYAEVSATTEYSFEDEAISLGLDYGTNVYGIDWSFGTDFSKANGASSTFDGTSVGISYGLAPQVNFYSVLELDNDFVREDVTVGVKYTF